jgi:hypothetical protein
LGENINRITISKEREATGISVATELDQSEMQTKLNILYIDVSPAG